MENLELVTSNTTVEPRTQQFLDMLNNSGATPMEEMAPDDARAILSGVQTSVPVNISGIETEEKTITMDGLSIGLVIVRPANTPHVLPAFMFFHGGGWMLGDFPTHQRFIRDLVVYSGAVAVYVDYSRAPESKYPLAISEAYAATRWVAQHGHEIGVDGSRLAVAGNSAGGNIAAVVALKANENKGPHLRFQLLFWPVTNGATDTSSYLQYASGHFLTRNMMQWFWHNYIPTGNRYHSYASPLNADMEQLAGLPPTLVQVAEHDVLRDEGEAYARKMEQANVPVSLVRVMGMIHDYGLLNPLATVPAVQSALRQAAGELKNALQ